MRHPLLSLAALCALVTPIALHTSPALAAPAAAQAATADQARVIVKLKPGAAVLRRQALTVREQQGERARALGQRIGLALRSGAGIAERTQVVFADGITSAALAARLAKDPDVEYAVVDQRRRAFVVPNDPRYESVGGNGPASGQWYLKPPDATNVSAIDAERAWDVTLGSSSVVVAVLDTGVRFDHPDLAGKLHPGYDFVHDAPTANDGDPGPADDLDRDADPSDPGDWITAAEDAEDGGEFEDCGESGSSWHGTQVAGLIGALTDNAAGMASVGRNVMVLPVRVLGKCGGYDSDIIAAMRWSAGLSVPGVPANPTPARVINLSLGGAGTCDASTGYPDAIAEVTAQNTVIVASAGNSTGHAVSVPANCAGVVAVGGLRHVGTKVGFSDLGPEISLSAPAGNCVNIEANEPCLFPLLTTTNAGTTAPVANSTAYTDSFNFSVGTSFSAPLVAGTAALMLSVDPSLTPLEVRLLMQHTSRPFPTSGGDNGDGTEVLECTAPQYDADDNPVDQLQCYCTTGTCGAGMLDARAAVVAASTGTPAASVQASIDIAPLAPVAQQPVTLTGQNSIVASGRQIVSYQWSLLDGGGIVTAIASPTAQTTQVTPVAAGSFKVRLAVQDSEGGTSTSDLTVVVNAAPAEPEPEPAPSGGGGGALGWPWLAALALAALAARRPRQPR